MKCSLPSILPGAEVRLEKNLSEVEGLDRLRMGNSRYILLELPFIPYKEWMGEEIDNIEMCIRDSPGAAGRECLSGRWMNRAVDREAGHRPAPVSYTHLDVYKRQGLNWAIFWVYSSLKEGKPLLPEQ